MTAAEAERQDTANLARGAGVTILGNIGRVGHAVTGLLIARVYGAEVLGFYALAWLVFSLAGRVVLLGQDPAIQYFMGRSLADDDADEAGRTVGSSVVLVVAIGVLMWAVVHVGLSLLAPGSLGDPRLATAISGLALALPASGALAVLLSATRARKVMTHWVIVRSFVEPLASLLGMLVVWQTGGGIHSLAVAKAISIWIATAAALYCYRRLYSLADLAKGLLRPDRIPRLVRYSLPAAGKELVALGASRTDLFLVGYLIGPAMAGIYTVVLEVSYLINKVRQALEPMLAPLVAEQHHLDDRGRMKNTYGRATRWALMLNMAGLGIAILAGSTILGIYGDAFLVGWLALMFLVVGQVIYSSFGMSEMMLMMTGRPNLMLMNWTILLVLVATFDYALIPVWGLTGAAIGTASASIAVTFVQVSQVRRAVGIHPFRTALLKPILSCLVAALLAWFVPLWDMPENVAQITRAVLFVVVYLILLSQYGLDPEERRVGGWIRSRLGRCAALVCHRT